MEERSAETVETDAWVESLEGVARERGIAAAGRLLSRLVEHGARLGASVAAPLHTPYVNTIPVDDQPAYPGDRDIERRIKSLIRWNAMAMVVKANKLSAGHRRTHLHLCLGGDAVRGGIQSLLPRTGRRRRRSGVLPGPCLAGDLRAGLSRGPAQ